MKSTYKQGILMSGTGMLILSPDGLLIRSVTLASTWDIIFYRSAFAALAIGIFLLIRKVKNYRPLFMNFGLSGWTSTLLMTLSNLSFVGAITNTSVANTLVLVATMPFFSAILGWIVLGETVRARTWISITLASGGIIIIFSGSLGEGYWVGDILAIVTAFLQGLNLVIIRKVKDKEITKPALCLSAILAMLIATPFSQPTIITMDDLLILFVMGFFMIPVALVLFLNGARFAPAADVALLALIETILGPIWVWIGIGEMPSKLALIGGSIVIFSILFNTWVGLKSDQRTPNTQNGS